MNILQDFPSIPGARDWPLSVVENDLAAASSVGTKWPLISIITPSFNQGAFLEKSLRSVLLQGYPHLEYIVIDGGSTDSSVEIIQKYQQYLAFWVSEADRGQSHAINKGFSRAKGELLGWLNSDDYLLPGALFKLAEAYLSDPGAGVVYGQGHIVNVKGKIIYTPQLKQATREGLFDWSFGNDFMQPSCLISQRAWAECGPLDESLHYSMDVDLFLKISDKYGFQKINDLLSISLSHSGAKTTVERGKMCVDLALVMMRHGNEASARRILNEMSQRLGSLEEMDRILGRLPLARGIFEVLRRLGLGRRAEL